MAKIEKPRFSRAMYTYCIITAALFLFIFGIQAIATLFILLSSPETQEGTGRTAGYLMGRLLVAVLVAGYCGYSIPKLFHKRKLAI